MTSRSAAPRPRRSLVAVAALVVAGAASSLTHTAPAALADTRCEGVWVVVDAAEAGGSTTTRCAPGDPPTGLDALEAAGHRYTFVRPNMPMVCTIDGRPDPCNGAPPDAYWSYWYAEAGGTWSYSSRGAGSRDPKPGQVEGWAFGAGEPPRVAPPAAAPPPEPEPSPSPTATSSPSPTPSPSRTTTTAPDAVEDAPSPTPSATAEGLADEGDNEGADEAADDTSDTGADEAPPPDDAPASTATAAPRQPRPSPTPRPTTPQGSGELPPIELRDADDEVALGRPGDGGATAGLIAGSALAAAIAGAGVFQARRRRLASEQPRIEP
jgi:hypothetical protein